MDRKLASIQIISDIQSILGADNIEVAHILGWKTVVNKGEFSIGDKCVYVEIDSVLPEKPEFEFLRKSCWVNNGVVRGFRIRTIKLRKQLSQGICFPISVLDKENVSELAEQFGHDVTDLLGIVKYEPYIPATMAGKIKGNFPSCIPKTDEIRIQNVPHVLEEHKGKLFAVTEKLAGTSQTCYINNNYFGVCSRNWELDLSDENNLYVKVALSHDIENKLRSLHRNIALQGEIVGPGVEKNSYILGDLQLFGFRLYLIDEQRFLDYSAFLDIMKNWLDIRVVPLIEDYVALPNSVELLLEYAKGVSCLNNKVQREGVVIQPMIEDTDSELGRLSFKVINNDYLLNEPK